jgi:hypothetical protein
VVPDKGGIYLDWSSFVVDETPHCMWSLDMKEQNLRYLQGIDPTFFRYVTVAHSEQLEGEKRQHAALAIRLAYAQALETFFALIGATVQAPNCPLGWMLMYENRQLFSVVRKLSDGTPLLTRDISRSVTWQSLSREINVWEIEDKAKESWIKEHFAATWSKLARDFLAQHASDEYNSIKHGLRVKSGGSSLAIGVHADGTPPDIDRRSDFGTRFFAAERLEKGRTNFHAQNCYRNWSPAALAVRLQLLALSIGNVVAYLRIKIGEEGATVHFQWPEQSEALELAWKSDFVFEFMSGGIPIAPGDIVPKSKSEILEGYEPL